MFRVENLGFGVLGSGALRIRVWGLGFKVWGQSIYLGLSET